MQIELKNGDDFNCISDQDLAVLADWAAQQQFKVVSPNWRRPFALLREGADTLLRRRARSREDQQKSKETL